MAATPPDMLLTRRWVAKPWGMTQLPAPFAPPMAERIGEIWFEPPPALDRLLVKYLFTNEKLSVQVHPSDAQTLAAGQGRQGKEECWIVIDARPGARIGIGLREETDAQTLRAAALDGSIEHLLDWREVAAGDFFYIPANTIHAIGGGLCVLEIQQNSDITYRLYDYGRPRALHLDEAVQVARTAPHDPAHRARRALAGTRPLVDGPFFRIHAIKGLPPAEVAGAYPGPLLAIPLAGEIAVGAQRVPFGQCALASCFADIAFSPDGTCLIAADRMAG